MKNFDTFGVMLDCSRNAVAKISELKNFVNVLSKMGYNMLMLYTEDTYEIEEEPFFGYKRGKYSADELKELDEYAASVGVELIPCIQTLGHLERIFRWRAYRPIRDVDGVILADEERTYELIDRMFSAMSSCIRSRRIHIGMDEAHMVGLGKYLDKHGYTDRYALFLRHLRKVCEIGRKYGYEMLMWEDMFFQLAAKGYFFDREIDFPKEVLAELPEDVTPVYWDYFSENADACEAMVRSSKKLSEKVWFAGGAWVWAGFSPHLRFSNERNKIALEKCKKHGVRNAMITLWADHGGECPFYASLPALMYAAGVAEDMTDAQIKKRFHEVTGESYDAFMALELPNYVYGEDEFYYRDHWNKNPPNYSKNRLFDDPFLAIASTNTVGADGRIYAEYAKRLHRYVGDSENFSYIFKTAELLCDALEIKFSLADKTRALYAAGDKAGLRKLADEDYTDFLARLEAFYTAFSSQWDILNKPYGFEVHDAHFGGLERRVAHCRARLWAYADGKIDKIDELCEGMLPMKDGMMPSWAEVISAGSVL